MTKYSYADCGVEKHLGTGLHIRQGMSEWAAATARRVEPHEQPAVLTAASGGQH